MSSVVATASAAAIPRTQDRFYLRMAVVCAAVAFVGFAPTYWVPMLRGTLNVPPLAHLHALLFYGWMLLFIRQTHLAATRRVAAHRELGIAGAALAGGMLMIGLGMAISSFKRADAGGLAPEARAFMIVSVSGILLFVGMFAVAVRYVRRPDVHKRLMLVATVSMLQAAVARWFLYFLSSPVPAGAVAPPPPLMVTINPGIVSDLLIVAAMIHDRRTTGRVHPVYWIAGGVVLAVQLLRIPLATTAVWNTLAQWILAFAP